MVAGAELPDSKKGKAPKDRAPLGVTADAYELLGGGAFDAHAVEGTVDEKQGNDEEGGGENMRE